MSEPTPRLERAYLLKAADHLREVREVALEAGHEDSATRLSHCIHVLEAAHFGDVGEVMDHYGAALRKIAEESARD